MNNSLDPVHRHAIFISDCPVAGQLEKPLVSGNHRTAFKELKHLGFDNWKQKKGRRELNREGMKCNKNYPLARAA
jgi:hypothetical protein